MKPNLWKMSAPVVAAAFALTSCEDEEQTKRIKELETENADYAAEIENLGRRIEEADKERGKLSDERNNAQSEARAATAQLTSAQRQIESMRKAEETRKEAARVKATTNPSDESKKLVREKLSAVWQVQGDQGTCRGVVAEADGKTWLYLPVSALGGSAKLTVKDAQNNTVTKFGEFQIAADANLARLEIKQDVPNRFTIDPNAALGENPVILVSSPAEGGGALKLDESQAGAITPADLEFNSYGLKDSGGCPLFSAESGALIALIQPPSTAVASLWDAPQSSDGALPRAVRLNRTIEWKPTTIGALLTERRKIDELNRLTKLIEASVALSPGASGLRMDAVVGSGSQSARQILEENKSMPFVQELFKFNDSLAGQKVRASERDIKRQVASLFGQIGNTSRKTATELRALKPSTCNRQDAENALKWNDEAAKKLATMLEGTGN